MPSLTLQSRQGVYATEGEGFPLILVPDAGGTLSDWAPSMPLLGELCRVVAYAYTPLLPLPGQGEGRGEGHARAMAQPPASVLVEDLAALLDALAVARAYLAGYAGGGQTALRFALCHPGRVEGLLLIGMPNPDEDLAGSLRQTTIPILLLVGGTTPSQMASTSPLPVQLPHCSRVTIPGAAVAPHREQPLRLGHAMLDFLMRCERQRHLVRGASFLL